MIEVAYIKLWNQLNVNLLSMLPDITILERHTGWIVSQPKRVDFYHLKSVGLIRLRGINNY